MKYSSLAGAATVGLFGTAIGMCGVAFIVVTGPIWIGLDSAYKKAQAGDI